MRLYSLLILIILYSSVTAQKHTLSGYVKDSKTKEALIGVTIYDIKNKIATTTNNSINVKADFLFILSLALYKKESRLYEARFLFIVKFLIRCSNKQSLL